MKQKEKKIYKQNTQGIEVVVRPEYMISQYDEEEGESNFIWAYHIKIENKSNKTIELISRYWKIIDEYGGIQEVGGKGVIGEQPTLKPGSNFNYSSGVNLNCPSGIMFGHYVMKKEGKEKEIIRVKIPPFSLDIPDVKYVVN